MTQQQDKARATSPKKRQEALIHALNNAEVTHKNAADIIPFYHLQKRTRKGDNKADAQRVSEESRELVSSIVNSLNGQSDLEVTPIWMVDTPEGLKLVDGHHRLQAFQEANCELVPVKVIQASMEDAHLLSDTANYQTQTVTVTKAEKYEIAWESLKRLRVNDEWTEGYTNREFARTRDVAAGTIDKMVKRLRELGAEYADSLTWKEARHSGDLKVLDEETRVERWIHVVDQLQLDETELRILAELINDMGDLDVEPEVAKNHAVKALSEHRGLNYNNIEHEDKPDEQFVF